VCCVVRFASVAWVRVTTARESCPISRRCIRHTRPAYRRRQHTHITHCSEERKESRRERGGREFLPGNRYTRREQHSSCTCCQFPLAVCLCSCTRPVDARVCVFTVTRMRPSMEREMRHRQTRRGTNRQTDRRDSVCRVSVFRPCACPPSLSPCVHDPPLGYARASVRRERWCFWIAGWWHTCPQGRDRGTGNTQARRFSLHAWRMSYVDVCRVFVCFPHRTQVMSVCLSMQE